MSEDAEAESAVARIEYEGGGEQGAIEASIRVSGSEEIQYGCLRPDYLHESKRYEVTSFAAVEPAVHR